MSCVAQAIGARADGLCPVDSDFASLLRCCERLIQISQDVFNVFEANAQPYKVRRDASAGLLRFVQLAVSRRGRVNCQALGVAHVRQMAEQLEALDLFGC